MKSFEESAERGPVSLAMWVIPRGFIICLMLAMCGGVFGLITNPFNQAKRVLDKTMDADNMIYNYEWFKSRHEAIKAIDKKIITAKDEVVTFKEEAGPRDNWHREDREESSRLSSIATGLEYQRDDLIAQYNARSRQVNRSIFKTGDTELPETIE